MHILEMQAAYGRLRGDSLRLEPGLNLIYAPNESGKSTWCSFIRTMLYGLPTRQSGPLADKNRFAPWTGEAMQGRMDLETDGRRWTVLRDTRRASAPMQNFACTYTGTAQPVPEINGQNLGETLLGVPREVFRRSAFIGQSGLAVSQDPELERRIAALLSTGQEDVSYSESYDRLKKQLNRRRHNKTGLIPQLEQEQARLDDALRRQAELTAQLENAREQQCTAQTRVEELEQRRAQWEALEKQEALRQWRETQEDLTRRRQQLTALQQLDGDLPDRDTLARMQAQLELLEQAGGTLTQARRIAQQRQTEAQEAQETWSAHPLYSNDENQLRQQAEQNGSLAVVLYLGSVPERTADVDAALDSLQEQPWQFVTDIPADHRVTAPGGGRGRPCPSPPGCSCAPPLRRWPCCRLRRSSSPPP